MLSDLSQSIAMLCVGAFFAALAYLAFLEAGEEAYHVRHAVILEKDGALGAFSVPNNDVCMARIPLYRADGFNAICKQFD